MYLPQDIWIEIKRYMFKTKEMKKYDTFVKYFSEWAQFINNIKFKDEPYEQAQYNNWSFSMRYMFIRHWDGQS